MWQVEWENIYLKNGRQRSACVNRLLEFALAVQYPLGSAQADFGSYLHKFLPWDLTSLGYICADGSLIIPDSSWFKWSKRLFCSCASHLVVNFGVCFPSSAILVNFPTRLSWPKQSWLGFFFLNSIYCWLTWSALDTWYRLFYSWSGDVFQELFLSMTLHCMSENPFKTEGGLSCEVWLGEKYEHVREEFIYLAVSCPFNLVLSWVYATKAT